MSETSVCLEQLLPIILERLQVGESVKFTPNGTSMLPMLKGGRDTIVLSPINGRLGKYELPLYRRDNGQYVLHRIVKVGKNYTCRGDNQIYDELDVRQDQLIGVVTAFTRNGKHFEVSDFRYKIYCRLICWARPFRRVVRKLRRMLS